jgi:hypothetical protein
MGQPVVHFEIIGNDPEKLRVYYGDLFGWGVRLALAGGARGVGTGQLRILGPRHLRGWDRHPGWCRRRTRLQEPRCLLRWRPECRGCAAASRESRRHTGDGSSHITEWSCRRSLQGPRRHPDRRRRRRMRAASQPAHPTSSAGRRQTIHLLLVRPGKQRKQMEKDGMIMAMQHRVTGSRR